MVNIEELRIGNWVKYLEDNTQINSISIGEKCGYVSTFKSGVVTQNQIDPIPITEECLLKCGFSCLDDIYEHGDVEITNIDGKFLLTYNCYEYVIAKKPIENLHQLQNLYFSLTGKELEVKL